MSDLPSPPTSDYLAKDYPSFRRLMLDQLAVLSPASAAAGPASLEMTLVEALAYLADNLSYFQDSVATEAYLRTARQRVSVARHARLLDYRLGEGCSARLWVQFESAADGVPVPCGTVVATGIPALREARLPPDFDPSLGEVFETLHPAVLTRAHNRMTLAAGCTPRRHDTQALLASALPRLAQGDVLVFRHAPSGWAQAVRLLSAVPKEDVTAIEWHDEDALHDLPLEGGEWSVLGNIVLADHGGRRSQPLPRLPPAGSSTLTLACADLGYGVPYRHDEALGQSAAAALRLDPREAEPAIRLVETARFLTPRGTEARVPWLGRREILGAGQFERVFAVEPAGHGRVTLRFGQGDRGCRLDAVWDHEAHYRSGGGSRGNVGAGTLAHVLSGDDRILAVSNPLPASGGADPETLDQARLRAPFVSREQRRCVAEADYAAMAELFPGVASARAERAWEQGGSKVTITVHSVDRRWDEHFADRLKDYLRAFQLIGDELIIRCGTGERDGTSG